MINSIYVVHSKLNEDFVREDFNTAEDAIQYAEENSDQDTFVEQVEVEVNDFGEVTDVNESQVIWPEPENEVESDEVSDIDLDAELDYDYEQLDETLIKESDEGVNQVKKILQPLVIEDGTSLRAFGDKDKIPNNFKFKASRGDRGIVNFNGVDYDFALVKGQLRVMPSSEAGSNWSETLLKEDLNEGSAKSEAASLIAGLIQDEWEAIKGYEDVASKISSIPMGDQDRVLQVLNHISQEEAIHVGQLEQVMNLVNPDYTASHAQGTEEGQEDLEEPMEVGEPEIVEISDSDTEPSVDVEEDLNSDLVFYIKNRQNYLTNSGDFKPYNPKTVKAFKTVGAAERFIRKGSAQGNVMFNNAQIEGGQVFTEQLKEAVDKTVYYIVYRNKYLMKDYMFAPYDADNVMKFNTSEEASNYIKANADQDYRVANSRIYVDFLTENLKESTDTEYKEAVKKGVKLLEKDPKAFSVIIGFNQGGKKVYLEKPIVKRDEASAEAFARGFSTGKGATAVTVYAIYPQNLDNYKQMLKEDIDYDKLREEMEENEDEVECQKCFNLVDKKDCIKTEEGYVCNHCANELHEDVNEDKPMRVCANCLRGIESREGELVTDLYYPDEDDEEDSKCDWCEESGFDELYEIIPDDKINDSEDSMKVCANCLAGIESHEGHQVTKTYYPDEDDEEDSRCDWCKDTGFDKLYKLI